MLGNMFEYSAPVSTYYPNNGDRVDETYYSQYAAQRVPASDRYSSEEWASSSPDYVPTNREVKERREPFEERTRTIRPDDYYDDRSRLYRSEERFSGRSARSARPEQDPNWYPTDTVRSSGRSYASTTNRRYANDYRTDSESSGKDAFDGGNDRTLRVEERDWYYENSKLAGGKAESSTLSRNRMSNVDRATVSDAYNKAEDSSLEHSVIVQPAVNQVLVTGLQKNQDNTCCGFLGNTDGTAGTRPPGGLVASYGVLDKNKGVVVGVAGARSDTPGDCWQGCCKPAILTLLVFLMLLVFALVAGLLFYFNYTNYKPRTLVSDEPCEKTFCRWGASCVRLEDGTARCQCPGECPPPSSSSRPVCGTDGRTHRSHCELRRDACERKLNIRAQHDGPCDVNDPCRDMVCGFGARCQASSDGRSAECRCPDSCPRYGDHVGSRPVCGTDGRDYQDRCEMSKAACDTNTNITIKFEGKCDPCASISCLEPEICQLDASRVPTCRCAEPCPLEFTPVCGSDGKTYSNECQARREACRSRRQLRIISRAQCSSDINPCDGIKCMAYEECSINKYGIANCECGPECEQVMRPVCSIDGRTFSSECELKRAACQGKMPIKVAHPGVCGEMGPCQGRSCQWGAKCVEHSGQARCECPQCSAEFDPVCGSDGISYGNECKLRSEACKYKREVTVLYNGPCNGCENKKCDHYSVCESDSSSEAKCVCSQRCEEGTEIGEVCGSDMQTYSNECQLRAKACKDQTELTVLFKGGCELCQNVKCKNGARCSAGECICPTECSDSGAEAVCANTMVTYPSECELQKDACQSKSGLTVIFYGDCRERLAVAGTPTTVQPSVSNSAISNEIAHGPTELPEKGWTSAEREACKDIHCDYEATCELGPDNFPRCSCLFDCATAASKGSAKPVCASDLRVYPSMCAMKLEACQRQAELRLRPLDLCQGQEVKPCNGESPIVDLLTGLELDCGNGPHRKDCPSGSYCHQTTRAARCCKKDKVQEEKKGCEDSWFGCCPDNMTPAKGPEFAGCPSQCNCNKLGSFSETCNPESQQCDCRPGVGGLKCDRCEPGYWGLPKISAGHQGCIPCGCSMFGSVREDCEQMTGRCVCKPGIQGQKCTICTSHDRILGPNGCFSADVVNLPPTSCKDLNCYFGAVCVETGGLAVCECAATQCPPESMDTMMVCGSDGQTYTSECHLRLQACRTQTDIVVQAFGICREETVSGTDWPLRRYTPIHYTQPDDTIGHLSKSTRHLLVPEPKNLHSGKEGDDLMPYHKTALGVDLNLNYMDKSTSTDLGPKVLPTIRTTAGTITALIGDLCGTNMDCLIPNTRCVHGACVCYSGYVQTTNRQECLIQPSVVPKIKLACDKSPCHYSSTCVDMIDGGFTCICEPYYTGRLCEFRILVQHYEVPSFDGHSYIIMKSMSAYHKFNIELEFVAFADNGILLYNQQTVDGSGDFISLAIVGGHIEMRYNLGDGIVSIVTPEPIQMNTIHKVLARRYHRDGMLKLDDGEDTVGQSRGVLKSLDLADHAYIGYIPTNFTRVFENIGIRQGFIGCIHRLKVGRSLIYPQTGRTENVYNTKNVQECADNPCSSMPCNNGGTCHALDRELYRCACVDGFTGDFCETVLDPCSSDPCENSTTCIPDGISFKCICLSDDDTIVDCLIENSKREVAPIPQFTGSSYVQLPKPEGLGKSFKIEIWFLAKKPSGLLLYTSQSSSKSKGDFISINLVEGKVQFRFNLGSGIASLTTTESITLETWHRVKVRRTGRDGLIRLDNTTAIRGSSLGPLLELNLEQPLYLGYIPSWLKVNRLSGITTGFLGAIQRVLVNGKSMKLLSHNNMCMFTAVAHLNIARNKKVPCSSPGVTKYKGPPCFKDTCSGHGICIPVLGDFNCQCDEGFLGELCNQREVVDENEIDSKMYYQSMKNRSKERTGSNMYKSSGLYGDEGFYEEIS